jgi:hypothetical protein
MNAVIAACAGFLLGILWMDLMFDVQTVRNRADDPEIVVSSIATYYRRVTTDASPMGRLIALVMLVALIAIGVQAAVGGTPAWASIWCGVATLGAVGLAGSRTVPAAVRLGSRTQPFTEQRAATTAIYRQHLTCAGLMASVLIVQLIWG